MSALDEVVVLEGLRDRLDDIREALGGGWPAFIRTARPLLVEASTTSEPAERARLVDELLEQLLATPAETLVRRLVIQARALTPELASLRSANDAGAMSAVTVGAQDASVVAAASLGEWLAPEDDCRYRSVPVYFATDRNPSGDTHPNRFFGGDRGPLSYGVARVSIPDRHESGSIERPWPLFPESPQRHVTLLDLAPAAPPAFMAQLRTALQAARAPKILVFVHGYKVPFADAARVVAQMVFDLNFSGIPLLYSWPSKGRFFAYTHDEANAQWTREHFLETLQMLRRLDERSEQHLLAHSMGNRVLFQGLQHAAGMSFGQVILAAPDEDADTLANQMHRFAGRAERTTLYQSGKDVALWLSQWIHGHARAGQAGVAGVDAIDASAVNLSLLGHSYFHEQRALLSDIFLLLENGPPPNQRPFLKPSQDGRSWHFLP